MQRPSRIFIKSSSINHDNFSRKICTPEILNNHQDNYVNDLVFKNLRETMLEGKIQTINSYVNNVENSDVGEPIVVKAHRAFKVRNFSTNNRIKESSIPIKNTLRIAVPKKPNNTIDVSKPLTQKQTTCFHFQNYPSNYKLHQIGTKIIFKQLSTQIDHQSPIVLIISQNLFSFSLNDQNNTLKIKQLCQSIRKSLASTCVILFRFQNQKEMEKHYKIWENLEIGINYLITPKNKFYQRITVMEITEIISTSVQKIVVLEDHLDYKNSLYYSVAVDQNREISIDPKISYLYITFSSFSALLFFSTSFYISLMQGKVFSLASEFKDETERIMDLEEIIQKIKVIENRKQLKERRKRLNSMSNKLQRQASSKSVQILQQKNEQFRKKMVQYIKILTQQKKSKVLPVLPKPESAQSFRKHGAFKLIQQKQEGINLSKTSNQIVYELLKLNMHIGKQIGKYQSQIGCFSQKEK